MISNFLLCRPKLTFHETIFIDALVKSPHSVIPAEAGIQKYLILLDRRVKPGDDDKGKSTFYETIFIDALVKSPYLVIPAKAGTQKYLILLDPGLVVISDSDPGRGDDVR